MEIQSLLIAEDTWNVEDIDKDYSRDLWAIDRYSREHGEDD